MASEVPSGSGEKLISGKLRKTPSVKALTGGKDTVSPSKRVAVVEKLPDTQFGFKGKQYEHEDKIHDVGRNKASWAGYKDDHDENAEAHVFTGQEFRGMPISKRLKGANRKAYYGTMQADLDGSNARPVTVDGKGVKVAVYDPQRPDTETGQRTNYSQRRGKKKYNSGWMPKFAGSNKSDFEDDGIIDANFKEVSDKEAFQAENFRKAPQKSLGMASKSNTRRQLPALQAKNLQFKEKDQSLTDGFTASETATGTKSPAKKIYPAGTTLGKSEYNGKYIFEKADGNGGSYFVNSIGEEVDKKGKVKATWDERNEAIDVGFEKIAGVATGAKSTVGSILGGLKDTLKTAHNDPDIQKMGNAIGGAVRADATTGRSIGGLGNSGANGVILSDTGRAKLADYQRRMALVRAGNPENASDSVGYLDGQIKKLLSGHSEFPAHYYVSRGAGSTGTTVGYENILAEAAGTNAYGIYGKFEKNPKTGRTELHFYTREGKYIRHEDAKRLLTDRELKTLRKYAEYALAGTTPIGKSAKPLPNFGSKGTQGSSTIGSTNTGFQVKRNNGTLVTKGYATNLVNKPQGGTVVGRNAGTVAGVIGKKDASGSIAGYNNGGLGTSSKNPQGSIMGTTNKNFVGVAGTSPTVNQARDASGSIAGVASGNPIGFGATRNLGNPNRTRATTASGLVTRHRPKPVQQANANQMTSAEAANSLSGVVRPSQAHRQAIEQQEAIQQAQANFTPATHNSFTARQKAVTAGGINKRASLRYTKLTNKATRQANLANKTSATTSKLKMKSVDATYSKVVQKAVSDAGLVEVRINKDTVLIDEKALTASGLKRKSQKKTKSRLARNPRQATKSALKTKSNKTRMARG